jgi:Cu(I)/Ag(I) efflux system membrane fusion protein
MRFQKLIILIILAAGLLLTGCSDNNDRQNDSESSTPKKEYYTCTMHPQVISDKPGVCPICGMELVKKIEEDESSAAENMEGMVSLSGRKQVLADVSIVKARIENLNREFTSYSYLDFVEQNRVTVSARFNGRLEKLFVDNTGDYIKKGDPLFEIYSPDLVQAQNEYLIALQNSKNESGLKILSAGSSEYSLLEAAKEKLQLLGMTAEQIMQIESSGKINYSLVYYSPFGGTIIEKKVQEGMYVNEGTVIYEIADLSILWNIAEVYENNLSSIKVGGKVKLHLAAYPDEEFEGRVTFIYPVVNQQTRTVRVRSEFINRGNKLKPQMYGETVFHSSNGRGILVPADAVLFTGKNSVVWIKTGERMFEPRSVKIGGKYDAKYHIISGINEGEEVAATGGFLIDSESQLRSGSGPVHQHDQTKMKEEETDHSSHQKKGEKNILREKNVKVSSLDINKDGKVFQCPMDFEVISDKPDVCPICSMDLEEFSIAEAQKNLSE